MANDSDSVPTFAIFRPGERVERIVGDIGTGTVIRQHDDGTVTVNFGEDTGTENRIRIDWKRITHI